MNYYGGIQKSSDSGFTWQYMDKNYSTTQFYHIGIGHDRKIIGGTQDNGSWVIAGDGNTPNTGTQLGAVNGFRGDGFQSYISWLDDDNILQNTKMVEWDEAKTVDNHFHRFGITV